MVSRKPHPAELRERAVQMVFEVRAETGNERGSIARVGHQLGINTETLRNWVNKAEVDCGQRPGTTTGDKKRMSPADVPTANPATVEQKHPSGFAANDEARPPVLRTQAARLSTEPDAAAS